MNFYQFLVPRLEGSDIEENFSYYADLTRRGVAGFIVFGGEMKPLREGISRLQELARMPLMISSDLEQGLGQQVKGGTLFPPAAAIAQCEKSSTGTAKEVFECIAREASYVGINTIFAPVLDIDTNPDNPIISTRAFSGEPETVSALGRTMIEAFHENGIVSCGKHFPGHGNTAVDSHLALPRVEKSLEELEACELRPFRDAVESGLPMMMLGHLSVPALDSKGIPVSLSKEAIHFLREKVGFKGIAITDAMNMGGLGSFTAAEASLMALEAGVDLLLHPDEPEKLAIALERSGKSFSSQKVDAFRKLLYPAPANGPSSPPCEDLASEVSKRAVFADGSVGPLKNPFVVILSDGGEDGSVFIEALRARYPSMGHRQVFGRADFGELPPDAELVVAVFSAVKAFKGGTATWIREALASLCGRTKVAVIFGAPQLIVSLGCGETVARIYCWWGAESAQLEAASILLY